MGQALAVGMVAAATGVRLWLGAHFEGVLIYALYYPAVLAAALIGGWSAGLTALALSALAGTYLFTPAAVFSLPTPTAALNLSLFLLAGGSLAFVGGFARSGVRKAEVVQAELREREGRYRLLFGSMSEAFSLCKAVRDERGQLVDYQLLEANPALQRMLERGPEIVGRRRSELAPGSRREGLDLFERVLTTGQAEKVEFNNPISKGWYEIHVTPVGDDLWAQFFIDVTERKRAETHQAEQFDELNHRVKNNLTVVSSLLSVQARNSTQPTVRDELMKAVDRVQSIADVHASLYRSGGRDSVEFSAYLEDLCGRLSQILADDGRLTLEVEAETAVVRLDQAVPLGLIVNELVTNAAKHAYPPTEPGAILVRFARTAPETVSLTISDGGRGLPGADEPDANGLGMKLVQSLVEQVGGRLDIRRQPGAGFEIHLPLAPPEAVAGA
jgi:two-component sensor histidine kinase/PAS domain-containing protein